MTCNCTTSEEWRKVQGWPYLVSNRGRVRHLRGRPRRLQTSPNGYALVAMTNGPERTQVLVHRLVAVAFIGHPPSDDHQVNHRDGQKLHNCDTNLEWVTASENIQHAFDTGLRNGADRQGEKHPLSKLTEDIVLAARREYLETDVRIKDLAERYGVSTGGMLDAVKGKTWGHLPGAVRRSVVRCAV